MENMGGDGMNNNMDMDDHDHGDGHNHGGDDSMSTPFCVGSGVTMSMFGLGASFNNPDRECVNLIFSEWTLDSEGKFAAGMIGVFFLSILTEAITFGQRALYHKLQPGQQRHMIMTSMYTCQVLLGFVLMLIVMSYSIELLFSVVAGLAAGYVAFVDDESGKPKSFDSCHKNHESASCEASNEPEIEPSKV